MGFHQAQEIFAPTLLLMRDQHKWTKSEVNLQYDIPHHCCVDSACSKKLVVVMRKIYLRQTKEGFKKSSSMIHNRKVLPRRNQDQVLPAALRLLREGPVGGCRSCSSSSSCTG